MSYWCELCPEDDELGIPVEEGTGFESLREWAEHVLEAHPEETEADSVEEIVRESMEEAEEFIEEVIEPTIEKLEAVEDEESPLVGGWSRKVDDAINRIARQRWELRRKLEHERDELHRPYFYELGEKYAEHYAEYDEDDYDVKPEPFHVYIPKAMAYEASEKLSYEVNDFLCLEYIVECLPEDHRRHKPEATR